MGKITAANSVFMLGIATVYPTPQRLQGYSADAAFETNAANPAEIQLGVDGKMSVGFVPFLTEQSITLQADSPSAVMFEQWMETQKAQLDIFYAQATIYLPSLDRKWTCTDGVLTGFPAVPSAQKVLGPRQFTITWRDISPAVA